MPRLPPHRSPLIFTSGLFITRSYRPLYRSSNKPTAAAAVSLTASFHTTRSTKPCLRQLSFPLRVAPNSRSLTVTPLRAQDVPLGTGRPTSRLRHFLLKSFAYLGVFVAVISGMVVAFFIYDASTYREDLSALDIPVSELALNPRRGGSKNLPIIEQFIDDDESEGRRGCKHKPKLVVLGTGWGNVAMLKNLYADDYHITVVSTSNHFLFTPLLPSATVGTLELRSLAEPVRKIVSRINGHFLKGCAEDVDFSAKLVEVQAKNSEGNDSHFYIPYDKLIIGVGKSLLDSLT